MNKTIRIHRLAVFFLAWVLGVWTLIIPVEKAFGDAGKGRPIYEKYCLLCHGPRGHGDGPLGNSLQPPATNFFSPESRNKPDAAWRQAVRDGHSETAMKDWEGELFDEEIEDVIDYVRKLAGAPDGRS